MKAWGYAYKATHYCEDCATAIMEELKEKGVADYVIEAALEEKAANYDEYEVAFNMAGERFERLRKLDKRKALKRLYDFLMRRGFKYETVRRVVEEIVK